MKVMLRTDGAGRLLAYVAKKDLEEEVLAVEPVDGNGAGRVLTLANGWRLATDWAGNLASPVTVEARLLREEG